MQIRFDDALTTLWVDDRDFWATIRTISMVDDSLSRESDQLVLIELKSVSNDPLTIS